MKLVFLFVATALVTAACTPFSSVQNTEEGCVRNPKLPPLKLSREEKQLLTSVSAQPRTALDYYMLLPKSYFRIMPDSPERRVTYIDAKTRTGDYLHAFRWFECDGGGFQVTLRLFRASGQTFVAISTGNGETIFDDGNPKTGEPSVTIERPSLWVYRDGAWSRLPDSSVPKISPRRVLAKYHHDSHADRENVGNDKSIYLTYILDPATDDIVITGRENFQSSVYKYGRVKWRAPRFVFE